MFARGKVGQVSSASLGDFRPADIREEGGFSFRVAPSQPLIGRNREGFILLDIRA